MQTNKLWVTTSKMEEYLSPTSEKRKSKLLFELEKKEKQKTKKLSKNTRVDEQEPSVQTSSRTRAVQVSSRRTKFTKSWKRVVIYGNTGATKYDKSLRYISILGTW